MRSGLRTVSTAVSAAFALALLVESAGAGSVRGTQTSFADGNGVIQQVKHKRHKRREPKAGEVIAGAILLGVLGVAVASADDNHYDDYYHSYHENYIRASDRNCRQTARRRYRSVARGPVRAETRHITYLGGNRYEVTGRVRQTDGGRSRRFVCRTRVGQVRRLDTY